MRKVLFVSMAVVLLAFGLWLVLGNSSARWSGVDETVIEKFAEQANRPPREPLINVDQGDLPLFFFLVAGAAGGFAAGYYFRELFPPRSKAKHHANSV